MMKLTTIGLYNFDNSLFDSMALPESVDRETAINTILINAGELPTLYASFDFMKLAIGNWSRKWLHSWERIERALTEEYNPIHNFDRHEDYEDIEKTARKGKSTVNGSTSSETDNSTNTAETAETKTSAFNESDYSPESKVETNSDVRLTGSTDVRTDSTGTSTDDTDRNLKHKAHLYGNIGVTESTAMIRNEIDLRSGENIYDIIADLYKNELCLYVY